MNLEKFLFHHQLRINFINFNVENLLFYITIEQIYEKNIFF